MVLPHEYCVIDSLSIPFSLTLSIQYMMSLDKRDVLSVSSTKIMMVGETFPAKVYNLVVKCIAREDSTEVDQQSKVGDLLDDKSVLN